MADGGNSRLRRRGEASREVIMSRGLVERDENPSAATASAMLQRGAR